MRKLLWMCLLLVASATTMAQSKDDLYQSFVNGSGTIEKVAKKSKTDNPAEWAGMLLEKSAKAQYAAIGLSAVSAGLFIGTSFMDDKYTISEKGELVKEENKSRKSMITAGCVCAVAAVISELVSIDFKMKAGKSLRLYATGNGGGMAFNF